MPVYKTQHAQAAKRQDDTIDSTPETVDETKLSADIEDVLDDIDEVLGDLTEEEALVFVNQFVQKGGQ